MHVLGWFLWSITAVLALLLLRVVFDSGRPERRREAALLLAIVAGLVVTLDAGPIHLGVSKLHLLWYVPLVIVGMCLAPDAKWTMPGERKSSK